MRINLNKLLASEAISWKKEFDKVSKTPRIIIKSPFGSYDDNYLGRCSYFQDEDKNDIVLINSIGYNLSLSKPTIKFMEKESINALDKIDKEMAKLREQRIAILKKSWTKSKKIVWKDDLIK